MADDPMTLSSVTSVTIRDGLVKVSGLAAGPADYNATVGAVMDLSAYVSTVPGGVQFGGCTAVADALVYPTWIGATSANAADGTVVFTWDSDSAADAVFEEVADQTNLSGYVWHFTVFGEPA